MKQDFFHPITFAKYGILKTTLYDDIDKDIKTLDLNYNPKYCIQQQISTNHISLTFNQLMEKKINHSKVMIVVFRY